jgi:hypothetical protein
VQSLASRPQCPLCKCTTTKRALTPAASLARLTAAFTALVAGHEADTGRGACDPAPHTHCQAAAHVLGCAHAQTCRRSKRTAGESGCTSPDPSSHSGTRTRPRTMTTTLPPLLVVRRQRTRVSTHRPTPCGEGRPQSAAARHPRSRQRQRRRSLDRPPRRCTRPPASTVSMWGCPARAASATVRSAAAHWSPRPCRPLSGQPRHRRERRPSPRGQSGVYTCRCT